MPRIHFRNWVRAFSYSAGALLLGWAVVKFVSSASGLQGIQPQEPLFQLSLRGFFRVMGGLELAVALVCLFGKRISLQLGVILWFATNLVVYRLGLAYNGVVGGLNGYSGIISNAFGVSHRRVDGFFECTVLYLFFGGLLFVIWSWWNGRQQRLHPVVKMSCPACGIHIEFASRFAGQRTSCPKCQAAITLHKPENLKMACFFCHEHIGFPPHAIGEKIRCPHCDKDITLKEPI